jgi:CheY-like chemotaxis protein
MHALLELQHSGRRSPPVPSDNRDNEGAARSEGRRRVLVVDDDIDTARSLSYLFDVWGCKAEYAINGIVALSIAQRLLPQIVILDLKLPDAHGAQISRQLRANPAMRQARIIAITGSSKSEDRERALAAGCDEVLLKPVPIQQLERLLGDKTGGN